jgi:hypothetical protein
MLFSLPVLGRGRAKYILIGPDWAKCFLFGQHHTEVLIIIMKHKKCGCE